MVTSAVKGQGLTTQIEVTSNATVPEYVNFSISKNFTYLVTLSDNSVYLLPGHTAIVQVLFRTANQTLPGTYVIPLMIDVAAQNAAASRYTEYMTFIVYGRLQNGVQVLGQTYMTNSLRTSSSIIQTSNNGNSTIRNATLMTFIPAAVASNLSQISATGLPYNISSSSSGYTITWFISYLPSGQATYAYYSVNNPLRPSLFTYAQNIFSVPSSVGPQSILKIVSITAPTFYTSSTSHISASLYYTGTTPQNVSLYLTGPLSVRIINPIYTMYSAPNQLLNQTFMVNVGNYTGTLLFYLYARAGSANITESIPVLVVPSSTKNSVTTIPITVTKVSINLHYVEAMAGAVVTIAVILIAYSATRKWRRRPRYDPERTKELVKLSKRLKGESYE